MDKDTNAIKNEDVFVNDIKDSNENTIIVNKETSRNVSAILTPTATNVWTLYTAFGGETINFLNVCNTWTATSVWVYLVPPNGTAAATNAILSSVAIAANESKVWLEWLNPARGYTIQVKSTSGNVCFTLTGK